LSTVRSSSGGSDERWHGVGAIPAKVGKRWVAGIWAGWSGRGEFRRGARAGFDGARRKKRKQARGGGVRVGFIGDSTAQLMGRSRAELKTAGGAGVPSGAWQPLGFGGPTWQGEGRTAEVMWRWEEE
jgi:hypothetical protein